MTTQYRVKQTLDGKNPLYEDYPLLPGDIITRERGGSWMKHAPGLAVGGFVLSDEDVSTLEPADDARWVIE